MGQLFKDVATVHAAALDRSGECSAAIRRIVIDEISKMADNARRCGSSPAPDGGPRAILQTETIFHLCEFTLIGATTNWKRLRAVNRQVRDHPAFRALHHPRTDQIHETNFATAPVSAQRRSHRRHRESLPSTPREARKLVVARAALRTPGNAPARRTSYPVRAGRTDGTPSTRRIPHRALLLFDVSGRCGRDNPERTRCSMSSPRPARLARLERFLIEQGLIDRTPVGRQLPEVGHRQSTRYSIRPALVAECRAQLSGGLQRASLAERKEGVAIDDSTSRRSGYPPDTKPARVSPDPIRCPGSAARLYTVS